jgi:hypothetical protein
VPALLRWTRPRAGRVPCGDGGATPHRSGIAPPDADRVPPARRAP